MEDKMNMKKWLKFNPYKKLWSLIGGRRWTYIRRDIYHLVPLVNIVVFVSAGFLAGLLYPVIFMWVQSAWYHLMLVFALAWVIGILQGHFYWGKKYIPNERGG